MSLGSVVNHMSPYEFVSLVSLQHTLILEDAAMGSADENLFATYSLYDTRIEQPA